MTQTIDAIYENGVLRPVRPLAGVAERARVRVTVETAGPQRHPLADCIGVLPDADAAELRRIVEDEFEKVDADGWQ
jgi:predicted DNA-binding antitoxin AbrB/MazE fold protein